MLNFLNTGFFGRDIVLMGPGQLVDFFLGSFAGISQLF